MKRSCSTFEDRKKVLFIKDFPFIFRIPGKDLTPSLCQLQQSPGLRLRSCHCPRHPQRSRTPVMTSLCHDYASVCHCYVSVSYWHCYVILWWLWQYIKSICHDYVTLVWMSSLCLYTMSAYHNIYLGLWWLGVSPGCPGQCDGSGMLGPAPPLRHSPGLRLPSSDPRLARTGGNTGDNRWGEDTALASLTWM